VLNAVLFIADPNMASLLRGMAGKSNEFFIESIVELTNSGYPVSRMLGTSKPDVLLVEMTDLDRDLDLAAEIQKQCPDIPLVGLASKDLQPVLSRGSNSCPTSFAVWPFTVVDLEGAISRAVHRLRNEIYDKLIAFLPGKAGSGASTVVLHTAGVLAQALNRKVLVMEGDLHSGLLSAMLRVEPKHSIRDALAEQGPGSNLTWQQYVTSVNGVDFLLTNTAVKEPVPAWTHYLQILRFTIPRYDLVMVDLPEIVNPATAEVVRRARAVYVVSTPEFASLKLSKQRGNELQRWEVEQGRVFGLLNRGHKSDIGAKDAEKILGFPVAATFPNDYRAVRKAITDGVFTDTRSDLGQAYLGFAKMLAGIEQEKKSSWFRK
jgi:MinD-like ATPase involved in chromosome partitioning or flagellar assembly